MYKIIYGNMYTERMQSTVTQDSVKPGIDLTQKHRLYAYLMPHSHRLN